MINYRTDDDTRWGPGKGSLLTPVEIDLNFWDLDFRISALEDNPPTAISIDHFEVLGLNFYVHMTDASVLGPYALPQAAWRFTNAPTGAWQSGYGYVVNDIFNSAGVIYLVLVSHTSAGTFDPGATDGLGHDLYGVLLNLPDTVIPIGGSTGQALVKASGADLDMAWASVAVPTDGSNGEVLTWSGAGYGWAAPADTAGGGSITRTQSSPVDIVGVGVGNYIRCTNATSCTVTVQSNSVVAIPLDSEFSYRAAGGGYVLFTWTSPVVVNVPDGFQPRIQINGGTVTLKKVGTDEWDLLGLLSPA